MSACMYSIFLMPSSSDLRLAYARLDTLRSIPRTLQFLYLVDTPIECCPVPHPATRISGVFRSIDATSENLRCSLANISFSVLGFEFNPIVDHRGYGFSSYCFLTSKEILSRGFLNLRISPAMTLSFLGSGLVLYRPRLSLLLYAASHATHNYSGGYN